MIGLIDVDGKLPNLALMKISTFYKSLGETVEFANGGLEKHEKIYASCLFSWNRKKCEKILRDRPDAIIGGSGWSLTKELPTEIERCKPDYNLYNIETIYSKSCKGGVATKESKLKKAQIIANMGIGFTSRGCIRNCGFCIVPTKEGRLHQESEIKDIINSRSNVITLYDNNLTADPHCIEKINEIRDRKLIVDISQGIDVRCMTEEKAKALSEVKHLRSLHYAWDLMGSEEAVLKGIDLLSQYVKKWRHMCYVLCGFNTTYEEDLYRVRKLTEIGVSPYVMKFNNRNDDIKLNHFARWVNGRIYKVCSFNEYQPWVKSIPTMNYEQMVIGG
jgi:hypothetical protein